MKRITISLEEDLYRIAKAYAQSEDISMSKAIVRMLRRVTHPARSAPSAASSVQEDLGPYRYRDPLTGFIVSRGKPGLTMEDVRRAENDEDERYLEAFRNPGP